MKMTDAEKRLRKNEGKKKYREKHKERLLLYWREYREKNKEKRRQYESKRYLTKKRKILVRHSKNNAVRSACISVMKELGILNHIKEAINHEAIN